LRFAQFIVVAKPLCNGFPFEKSLHFRGRKLTEVKLYSARHKGAALQRDEDACRKAALLYPCKAALLLCERITLRFALSSLRNLGIMPRP